MTRNVIDIVTCEFPPEVGGVGAYTSKVSAELEQRGHEIRVWSSAGTGEIAPPDQVNRTFGRFKLSDISRNERLMGTPKGRRLLLQWEPVGFGLQSLNLPFCLWIATRVLRGTRLVVMFHETFLPFNKRSLKRYLAGTIQRLMAFTLINSAQTVFASAESGVLSLQRLCFRPSKILHLPVFSNIETRGQDARQVSAMRQQFARPGEILVGHFGLYMAHTEPLVMPALEALLKRDERVKVLFIGGCGARYHEALLARSPELGARVFASGVRPSEEIARLILACDVMFQPYPGGITTKRGSAMASLAQGRCIVSNKGPEMDRLWNECAGVRLLETPDPAGFAAELIRLAAVPAELAERGTAASAFYQDRFSLEHSVDAVLTSIGSAA
jgi:glycosyltransferase involved in cell wall biosynthesis